MQFGLSAESFGATGALRVRMGVHTCEAQYRDGDYFGPLATMGASATPERIERATAAARAQLGDSAYDDAFARGAAMSYDEAIAYAGTQLDRAIAENQK